jgi:hypothetical protein
LRRMEERILNLILKLKMGFVFDCRFQELKWQEMK